MKTGMKSRLGLGFMAAIAALYSGSLEKVESNRDVRFNGFGGGYAQSQGTPWYFTANPNRKRKQNKLRLSHNAKLKRRKAA